jgi:hypothetical protein
MTIFHGPLFIVGVPRSGTKVLRDLLNRSPDINLCDPETHFIPYLYQKFGPKVALHSQAALDALYKEFDSMPFQMYSRRMGKHVMSRQDFEVLRGMQSWEAIFEVILRFYASSKKSADSIWGDKTPSYMLEMPLIKKILPPARFLHIIRDPRDVALSSRKAWGHSLYRVATKWRENILKARRDATVLPDSYLEIHYEDLIRDAPRVLTGVCRFLERDFVPEMTTLSRPSENIGDAKGKPRIVSDNLSKYKATLPRDVQERIEEIVYPLAIELGYEIDFASRYVPLPKYEGYVLKLLDGSKSAARHIRDKGLVRGAMVNVGNRIQKRRR